MDEITPFAVFLFAISGVMVANIMMVLTARAVAWYRRSNHIVPLYIAGLMIAVCALIILAPLLAIKPPY